MPDSIIVPLPITDTGVIWTRKADVITRHTQFSDAKANALIALIGQSATTPTPALIDSDSTSNAAPDPIIIEIITETLARIDGVLLSPPGVRDTLIERKRTNPNLPVEIRPAVLTKATALTTFLNACAAAGISNLKTGHTAPPSPTAEPAIAVIQQATDWLHFIDESRYSESWKLTAAVFRAAVPEAYWTQLATSARAPFGAFASREFIAAQSIDQLPATPGGPHLVMQFNTSFAQKKSAIETVTFTRETDGQWRASGYFIR